MKNTGITYTSAERSPVILPEMAELLPPLSAEQSAALEEDLLRNGCYSPVIVNEDMVIVDGHNRQALCEKHGLPYTMAVFSFEDLLEAKQWALDSLSEKLCRHLSGGLCHRIGLCDLLRLCGIPARHRGRYAGGSHHRVELCGRTDLQYAGAGGRDQDERPHHPGTDGPWLIQRHRPSVLTVSSPFSRALRTR